MLRPTFQCPSVYFPNVLPSRKEENMRLQLLLKRHIFLIFKQSERIVVEAFCQTICFDFLRY